MKVNGPIYSPALKANMPIFEAALHFIEPVRRTARKQSAFAGSRAIKSLPTPREAGQARVAPFTLELTEESPVASPPPLRGRNKEGGRAVLRDKRAAAYSIISSARATPHPRPPPQEGAGALTPSILTKTHQILAR